MDKNYSLFPVITKNSWFQVPKLLEQAWSKETSSESENWSEENPALGQCAVSALFIQEIFGGKLVRALINGKSHYWNRFPNSDVDFTIQQFPSIDFVEPEIERTREYVLSFPATVNRYLLLLKNLRNLDSKLNLGI